MKNTLLQFLRSRRWLAFMVAWLILYSGCGASNTAAHEKLDITEMEQTAHQDLTEYLASDELFNACELVYYRTLENTTDSLWCFEFYSYGKLSRFCMATVFYDSQGNLLEIDTNIQPYSGVDPITWILSRISRDVLTTDGYGEFITIKLSDDTNIEVS